MKNNYGIIEYVAGNKREKNEQIKIINTEKKVLTNRL